MSLSVDTKFAPLTFTKNNLVDVIKFINDKNIVALHTTNACRVFHAISFKKPESAAESLKNVRVIYLDCNSHEGLLGPGEWEWYIKDAIKNVKELGKCELRNVIIEQSEVPNKKYVSLGY